MIKTFALLLALNSVNAAANKCACEAQKHNFTIDCGGGSASNNNTTDDVAAAAAAAASMTTVTDALTYLQTNGCSSDCISELCEKNFFIVQSHYDHCLDDDIPSEIGADLMQNFQAQCFSCAIVRQEIDGALQCPTLDLDCTDGTGSAAYDRLVSKGCNELFQCTSANCKDDWLLLQVVRAMCGIDSLSVAAQRGYHSLEEPCKAFQCNLSLDVITKTLECSVEDLLSDGDFDHDHNDHDHDEDDGDGGNKSGPSMAPTGGNVPATDSGAAKFALGTIVAIVVAAVALF
ncbi:unnamed protein product [Cylindrotheca closterium]|uniref:Uncharacterized protein n=1 Tax=Cylindrotheca closterium TaxID=2856 RepID=A0AAD2CH47_9STRA|nr:unnamed protein product [Cylindrotheca closterium]